MKDWERLELLKAVHRERFPFWWQVELEVKFEPPELKERRRRDLCDAMEGR